MPRRHAARPRLVLVVDNSSSSLNSTSCSRAKRNKTKCHLAGIPPRNRHIETVFDRTPGKSCAKADGPPNREITSVMSLMDNSDITNCNVPQASKCAGAAGNRISHAVSMKKLEVKKIDGAVLDRRAAERVAQIEDHMDEDRKVFAARMGLSYGAYKNALSRKKFTGTSLLNLAVDIDASLDFVCGFVNEPRHLRAAKAVKTFWDKTGTFS